MAIHALISPGGSPGVTTTVLALALSWPGPVIVAECDPGGGDILAGLFAGHRPAPVGLIGVALEAGRGVAAVGSELTGQLAALDESGWKSFLAGITDPRQAAGLAPAWPAIASALASQPGDVIADCGRLDAGAAQPLSILGSASTVTLVMRPTLRQAARAVPRVELAAAALGTAGRLGILLVGDRGHSAGEVAGTLGVPVLGSVPFDPKTAAVLSDGQGRRNDLAARPLMRAARAVALALGQPGGQTPIPQIAVAPAGVSR